jgi:hypothetical protein
VLGDARRTPHVSWGISQVGTVKAPVSSDSYSWGQGWPTYRSGLKSDSNEVAVEGLKAGASEVLYETFTLVTDAGKGDDTITQVRSPPTPSPCSTTWAPRNSARFRDGSELHFVSP